MVKIVTFISDTHGHHRQLDLPGGDILVHTGDFSEGRGSLAQTQDFNNWMGTLSYDNIILVAGNHDFLLEQELPLCREMLTNCHLLMGQEIIINGLKFYGDPSQPRYCDWAFNKERGSELKDIWARVPDNTDILLTHTPPHGMLDFAYYGQENVGCEDLAQRIIEVCPILWAGGHIHEGYGYLHFGGIEFINSSICNLQYEPVNKPFVVEIDETTKNVISVL